MDPILLLVLAAAGGYYVYSKQAPAAVQAPAQGGALVATTQMAVDDPNTAAAIAAAQAAGITPTDVRTTTYQATVIPPGSSTPTQQTYTVTTVNTNPGDSTQGITLADDAARHRMAGNYMPNPPIPASGSAVSNLIRYSGRDLQSVLMDMATGRGGFDTDGSYRMSIADWNWYRLMSSSGMRIVTESEAGSAWGHLLNQEEYLTAADDPAQFQSQYAGHLWA